MIIITIDIYMVVVKIHLLVKEPAKARYASALDIRDASQSLFILLLIGK